MNTNTDEFQRVLKWTRIALVVLAVFLAAQALGSIKNLNSIDPAYNSISVTGEGEAVSVPDVAAFSFTVSAEAREVSDAQAQVTEKMNNILAGLKELGIEDRDIKTTEYSVWPKYSYVPVACMPTYCPPSRQVQDGYTANHSVYVKVREMENAGKTLALAGERGATNLSGLSFTVDDPDQVMNEARAEAIADAKSKAKTLSKELGVKLVRVVSFYDNTGGPMPYYAEGLGGDAMLRSAVAPAPTLPAGENKVKVNVTVIYEIR